MKIQHISTVVCSAAGAVPADYVQGIKWESVIIATSLKHQIISGPDTEFQLHMS